jgi:hypothetical protein
MAFIANYSYAQSLKIPIVVHVVYNKTSDDISDIQIQKMIDTLNLNFKGLSTNKIISREIFDTLIANTEIEFCLVNKDSKGVKTTGILHIPTSLNPLLGDFEFPTRISAVWDEKKFFNVWIFSMGSDSKGMGGKTFTSFFGDVAPFGVSVNKDCANWSVFQNVLAHEVGHYWSLYHTFETTDEVDDTPCSTDDLPEYEKCDLSYLTKNTCSSESSFWGLTNPPDMIENFMSYHLPCSKMFTKGQKERMRSYIVKNYSGLLDNKDIACNTVGIESLSVYDESPLAISPNPASSAFYIKNLSKESNVKVYNEIGKLIHFQSGVTFLDKVNTAAWPSGLYYVIVENEIATKSLMLVVSN